MQSVGTNLPVALVVAAILAWLGVLIAKKVARTDAYPALAKVMIASVLLHLLFAPLQIFVVDHFYAGVADWLKYDHLAAVLANTWRSGHFNLAGVPASIGNGTIGIAGAVVMTLVGPNQLAAFFVCSWLAYVGCVFFYLAFRVTFPRADRRRYAILVFLFPSLLFWTADVSKEAFMLVGLGLAAYGIALVMVGKRGGYLPILVGGALALFIRPNEVVILVVGFALAMLRARHRRQRIRIAATKCLQYGGGICVRRGDRCRHNDRGRPLPARNHQRRGRKRAYQGVGGQQRNWSGVRE